MKSFLSRPEVSALVVLAILIAVFQFANPVFLSYSNIATMLRAMALPGLIAIGMCLCLLAGAIDLSVGAIAGFSSCLASYLMMKAGWPIVPSLLIAVLISGLIGAINCFAIFKFKINAFITTIGMMYILRGLANYVTNGMRVYPIPEAVDKFGQAQPLGISWAFFIFVACLVIMQILLNNTVWGLEVRATGSDRTIAKDTEVRVDFISFSTFTILGLLSGLAGILAMARISAGDPTLGTGWEFQSILASAIGGVSLFGFSGSPVGMLIGLMTMQVISTGLVEIGVSPYLQSSVLGVLLIFALAIDVRKRLYLNPQENC